MTWNIKVNGRLHKDRQIEDNRRQLVMYKAKGNNIQRYDTA